jgi:hypothetical protein
VRDSGHSAKEFCISLAKLTKTKVLYVLLQLEESQLMAVLVYQTGPEQSGSPLTLDQSGTACLED